jgi:hypothetical protein
VTSSAEFGNVTAVDHPVITQKPTELRDVSSLLATEAPRNLLLTPAVREFLLDAPVGFISMYRDAKTHEPVKYYAKVLLTENGYCFVVDPMFATRRNHHHRGRFPEP